MENRLCESNKPNIFSDKLLKLNIGFRHNIVGKRLVGESSAVDVDVVNKYRSTLPKIVEDFAADDIYNADETALFFKCLPNKTLAYKGDSCHGGKANKERVTVLPICNFTGKYDKTFFFRISGKLILLFCSVVVGTDKRKLIVVGKSLNPRCDANSRAWMTGDLFTADTEDEDEDDSQETQPEKVVGPDEAKQMVEKLRCFFLNQPDTDLSRFIELDRMEGEIN